MYLIYYCTFQKLPSILSKSRVNPIVALKKSHSILGILTSNNKRIAGGTAVIQIHY